MYVFLNGVVGLDSVGDRCLSRRRMHCGMDAFLEHVHMAINSFGGIRDLKKLRFWLYEELTQRN